jgi:hypothetical protein
VLHPTALAAETEAGLAVDESGVITASIPTETNAYTIRVPITATQTLTGLRLDTLPDAAHSGAGFAGGNFVITRVRAEVVPPAGTVQSGRFVRIELPGSSRILSLAEVQVFHGDENIAAKGTATQSSTAFDGPPQLAIDGDTNGDYNAALTSVNRSIEKLPSDAVLHEFRGLVLFAQGNYQEAAGTIHAVLAGGPGWDWQTLRGLYPSVDVYTQQLRALESYASSHPDSADARFLLGYHYMTEGYRDAAIRQFTKVTKLQPDDVLAHVREGRCPAGVCPPIRG